MKYDDETKIPKGMYCYTIKEITDDRITKTNVCPYWKITSNKPDQMNGYCEYLQKGDWEENGTNLLWDMVKECGVNDEIDFENDLQFVYSTNINKNVKN